MSDNNAQLFGLDVGTTTSSALVATATIVRNCVTGRRELSNPTVVFRSEPVFTAFRGADVDLTVLIQRLDRWIDEANLDSARFLSGAAIITGLAARANNTAAVAQLIRRQLGDALVVTADDPRLESWLAFLGNCLDLSRAWPETAFLNLDIGGGTTNPAWGLNGEVREVGCYYVGARHVRVRPGTWRIEGLSPFAVRLFEELGVRHGVGDVLAPADVDSLLGIYVTWLEAIVAGNDSVWQQPLARLHQQVAFRPRQTGMSVPPGHIPMAVTFSGGVGELIYRCARGEQLPSTTEYGDLGVELARRICESPLLSKDLTRFVPKSLGRATVYGLTLHTADLSGATLFLPHPELLPLSDLPVIGCVEDHTDGQQLAAMLELAKAGGRGACLQIDAKLDGWQAVKRFGQRFAAAWQQAAFPPDKPLVLLTSGNIGKTLGQYVTDWGRSPPPVVVIDEIPLRRARFVSVGRLTNNLVPVSFYGLCDTEERG